MRSFIRKLGTDQVDGEEWRSVVGAPSYEVSSLGRVRRGKKDLRLRPHPRGYLIVDISIEGTAISKTVHRLVADAFLGPAPGKQVNHLSGVKSDNRVPNLEWTTARENTRHAIATGLRGVA